MGGGGLDLSDGWLALSLPVDVAHLIDVPEFQVGREFKDGVATAEYAAVVAPGSLGLGEGCASAPVVLSDDDVLVQGFPSVVGYFSISRR